MSHHISGFQPNEMYQLRESFLWSTELASHRRGQDCHEASKEPLALNLCQFLYRYQHISLAYHRAALPRPTHPIHSQPPLHTNSNTRCRISPPALVHGATSQGDSRGPEVKRLHAHGQPLSMRPATTQWKITSLAIIVKGVGRKTVVQEAVSVWWTKASMLGGVDASQIPQLGSRWPGRIFGAEGQHVSWSRESKRRSCAMCPVESGTTWSVRGEFGRGRRGRVLGSGAPISLPIAWRERTVGKKR
jgi:hypothetical protein